MEINTVTRVQILYEAASISNNTDTFGEKYASNYSHSCYV